MVDYEVVKERLMRGAFVGAGSFVSSTAGGLIEEHLNLGDMGTAAGQVVVGAGVSVGADEVFEEPESIPNEFLEFAGYGIQGAGFANLGEALAAQTGASPSRSSGEVVKISTDSGSSSQTGSESRTQPKEEKFLADVA